MASMTAIDRVVDDIFEIQEGHEQRECIKSALLAFLESREAGLINALKGAASLVPLGTNESMCHVGITTVDKCSRCQRAAAIHAVIAERT